MDEQTEEKMKTIIPLTYFVCQGYMEMTKEHISFNFDPRDIVLSLQTGFRFVRATVTCAIF